MGDFREFKRYACIETGISIRHLDYILKGDRNASPETARRLEDVLGVHKTVWVFGTSRERRRLLKRAMKRFSY